MLQRAVITGATKGIGRAITAHLWQQGYALAVCARTAADLAELQEELLASRPAGDLLTQVCDVSEQASLSAFAKTIHDTWGSISALINNAGKFIPGKLVEEESEVLQELLNTNVLSVYYLTKALLPTLRNSPSAARIINISSVAGLAAYPAGGSYSVSKFALRGLSAVLREELKAEGIGVTTIYPGPTWSDSWKGVDLPATRLMRAADVAQMVAGVLSVSPQAVVEEIVMRPQLGDL